MFLLFHTFRMSSSLLMMIYIPICFYYFDIIACGIQAWLSIYIPICFYYFAIIHCNRSRLNSIYIPICFYYFEWCQTVSVAWNLIYIPICFYYFQSILTFWQGNYSDLHSNMFLLFLTQTETCRHSMQNLHSNMFLLFRKDVHAEWAVWIIYIPICFYYFSFHIYNFYKLCLFTFQYVSIISYKIDVLSALKAAFTFQYVSIISEIANTTAG